MAALSPPDPPLGDELVSLRGWRASDAEELTRMFQDRELGLWTRAPWPYRRGDAEAWLAALPEQMRRGDSLPLAVTRPSPEELLGSVELRMRPEGRAELGYAVAAWARRQGVGTSAVRLVSRYAFAELGVARLEILAQPANAASIALAERVGFVREGLLRSHSVLHGRRYSMVMLSLLPGDLEWS